MRYTDTLINVLKSGKSEQPETLLRDFTETKEKYARSSCLFICLLGMFVFLKITLIIITGTKLLNRFGYQQVLFEHLLNNLCAMSMLLDNVHEMAGVVLCVLLTNKITKLSRQSLAQNFLLQLNK